MAKNVEALKAKLAKFEGTLARHEKSKANKIAKLAKTTDENDRFWLQCDIEHLDESIQSVIGKMNNVRSDISFAEMIERRNAKKEERVPQQLKDFRARLVESWDEHDRAERDAVLQEGESWWKSGKGTYSAWYAFSTLTDERIHELNCKAANAIVENLIDRVEKAVGQMKSFDHLYLHNGNWMEGTALNGWIEGENGRCEVRSIRAGGYNIQRLHIRVLTLKMK